MAILPRRLTSVVIRRRTMQIAFIGDAIRTPFGHCGGALASVRPDDLAAIPLKALVERIPGVDWIAPILERV